ncbi:hypothetical protein HW555_002449 [Spodoptera exigua]|uniref:Double-strand break repair protein n=1 Tax=Spodoptera exigua TaxID=7107 RepID=A0A835GRD6_SPOEX|nr:hypothetical protein HW555_002449 [Spodoptera exigua]
MVGNDSSSWSQDETIRILIASDIHLGYLEEHPIRGEDSFIAFEETLSLAVQYDVDLVLLGGDLFHHAKPSLNCIFKCTEIIRKYCFGDKPVSIELLSDQTVNFSRNVNYEDPNLNVSYPILSIHGNHDDPVGREGISSLDILSTGGLVNYFGKWTDYTHVRISPVLLQKGATKLALYGLSHLKDQRLSRLFQEKKVEMLRDEEHSWFNILVLHQNRAEDRGAGNFIKEDELPKFLDLVVWGHEHDCELFDMKGSSETNHFNVIQPGSTVATSLAAGEARPKHCAMLQIHKTDFILTAVPLKTVRPFVFKTVVLSEHNLGDENVNESEKVQEFLKEKVNEAIVEAKTLLSGDPRQPTMPLIRLSVFYEREDQIFNRTRFGQNFNGLVANSNDILILKRERKIREKRQGQGDEINVADYVADSTDVETLLQSYYEAMPPERRLAALPVQLMTEAVRDYTLKQNEDILRHVLEAHRRRCITTLLESNTDTEIEAIADRLRVLRDEIDSADTTKLAELKALPVSEQIVVEGSSDEELQVEKEVAARGRGRGSRGGRGSRARGSRARGRGREPEVSEPASPVVATTERRSTPRRTAAQKSATWIHNLASKARRRDSSEIDDSE